MSRCRVRPTSVRRRSRSQQRDGAAAAPPGAIYQAIYVAYPRRVSSTAAWRHQPDPGSLRRPRVHGKPYQPLVSSESGIESQTDTRTFFDSFGLIKA